MLRVFLPAALVAGACLACAASASAGTVTFVYTGTVASFVDVDDVYGFGAGANLAGDSVTDTYVVDTSSPSSVFSSGLLAGGGAFQEWYANLPAGVSSATSTIDGHTVSVNLNVFNYSQQYTAPPASLDQSLIESQGIGRETTGTSIGSEFLIRDEALSYSHVIPLALNRGYTLTLPKLTPRTNGLIYDGVFLPYSSDGTVGYFDMTRITVNGGLPEPSTWAMMLLGLAGLGAAARLRRDRGPVSGARAG